MMSHIGRAVQAKKKPSITGKEFGMFLPLLDVVRFPRLGPLIHDVERLGRFRSSTLGGWSRRILANGLQPARVGCLGSRVRPAIVSFQVATCFWAHNLF
jgi:hypothetical protein